MTFEVYLWRLRRAFEKIILQDQLKKLGGKLTRVAKSRAMFGLLSEKSVLKLLVIDEC